MTTPAAQMLYPDEDGVLAPHPTGLLDLTNDEYHSGPGISKSHLDAIASASPRHYWHKYINPNRERAEPTAAMIMGTAVHTAILEPDIFPSEVVQSPGFDRRTKNGKAEAEAFAAMNAGKIVLEPKDYETCLAMRDAVHTHPVAAGLLMGGKSEQSFYAYDTDTGELVKCRFDYLHDSGAMSVDLKTTEDASPNGFGKSSANFRYPIQTAWYDGVLDRLYGEHPQTWVFLAVEKNPPYAIGIYMVSEATTPQLLEAARIAARRDFHRIVEHKRSGVWDDYGVNPTPLALPNWARL